VQGLVFGVDDVDADPDGKRFVLSDRARVPA